MSAKPRLFALYATVDVVAVSKRNVLTGLLSAELVARKRQNLQTFRRVLVVHSRKLCIVLGR
jgi:hypothetical protein